MNVEYIHYETLQDDFVSIVNDVRLRATINIIKDGRNFLDEQIENIKGDIQIMKQIKAPSSKWVTERLQKIETIIDTQEVTLNDNPDGLLGKEGSYQSCIYFSTTLFDSSGVPGDTIVEKGTDGGGAIEVYNSIEDAKARCEYLAEFDNTILYTGSYALVGTMVIRTSYILDNNQQKNLTDEIIKEFTKI